jgi:capsular exopolysaccharide synthesis family protein
LNKAYPFDVTTGYPRGPYPAAAAGPEGENVITIQRVLRAVRRRLSLMVAVFILVFSAVAVSSFQLKPMYTATSRIIVNTQAKNVVDFEAVLSGMPANSTIVDTEAEILRSRTLIGKVVDRLDLVNSPEFNWSKAEPSDWDKRVGAVKGFIKSLMPFGNSKPAEPAGPPPDPVEAEQALRDGIIDSVRGSISVNRVGSTYLIEINGTSADPKMAAKLANTLADVYLDNQLDVKYDATRNAQNWLDLRISELREEVRDAESAVEAHRAQSGLLAAAGTTLTEQNIRDLNAQLITAQSQYSEKSARLRTLEENIKAGVGIDMIGEAQRSQVMGDLRAKEADLTVRKAEVFQKYLPSHPEYQRVLAEEKDLTVRVQAELQRVAATLGQEVLIARETVSTIQSSLNRAKGELAVNNRAGIEQAALEREAEASRTLLDEFSKRFKQTDQLDGITEADAIVDSYAPVPGGPSFPNTKLNLMLGVLLGLAVAGFIGLVVELLDNYLSSPEEVEQVAGVPYIGQIPLLPAAGNFTKTRVKPEEYLIDKPHSGFAEAYRHLRASIMFADIDKAAKTVAVVSSLPSEGKTSMTYCLGRMAAMSGTKTIVIDGDIRLRQLTEISGVKAEAGLLEYLFGEARLAEAVHTDEKTGLHILPLSDRKHTPRDVFGSRAFDALLNMLQQTYDLIIIDTGPILLMAETRVVTSKVDQVVVATRWRKTNRGTLRDTMKILRDFHANIAGVVLTFVDLRKRAHHAYTTADYKAYSKYYHND